MQQIPIYEQPWFGILVGVVAGTLGLVLHLMFRRRKEVRGFEVKRTTGETPVQKTESDSA